LRRSLRCGDGWLVLVPVTERGNAVGILKLSMSRRPHNETVDYLVAAADAVAYVLIASGCRCSPRGTRVRSPPERDAGVVAAVNGLDGEVDDALQGLFHLLLYEEEPGDVSEHLRSGTTTLLSHPTVFGTRLGPLQHVVRAGIKGPVAPVARYVVKYSGTVPSTLPT
jgi:hypothetical protein